MLLEAKKVCPHGEWSVFLEDAGIGCTCYHPLFVFNQFGDLERCALRPGNVHSAHEWRDMLDPVVARYRNKTPRRYFRGDAAFASPEVYEFLEAEGFKYAIRLPANKVLHDSIAHLLKRPVGRPPKEVRRYYANFSYRAGMTPLDGGVHSIASMMHPAPCPSLPAICCAKASSCAPLRIPVVPGILIPD